MKQLWDLIRGRKLGEASVLLRLLAQGFDFRKGFLNRIVCLKCLLLEGFHKFEAFVNLRRPLREISINEGLSFMGTFDIERLLSKGGFC